MAPCAAGGETTKAWKLVRAQAIQAIQQVFEKPCAPLAVFSAAICLITGAIAMC